MNVPQQSGASHLTALNLEGIKAASLGKHVLGEFLNCDYIPETAQELEMHMLESAKRMNATIVESVFHEFNPIGLSGVVVIAESHLAIHTWPEYKCVALDIFTCGDVKIKHGLEYLIGIFKPKNLDVIELPRGKLVTDIRSSKV